MTKRHDFHSFRVLPILFLFFLQAGCSQTGLYTSGDFVIESTSDRIVVAPFRQIFPENVKGGAVESPVTGQFFESVKPLGSPEWILETDFLTRLEKKRPGLRFVAKERVAEVFRRMSSLSLKMSPRQALCETGRELGADLVVAGYVYRFRERIGESFAVEEPASVAFEIVMLRVETEELAWRAVFDYTQKSLLEDLFQLPFFLKGKGRWLKAEELLEDGIGQVIETFPEFK